MKSETRPITLTELEEELRSYEKKYGVRSEDLAYTFRGEQSEQPDIRRWSALYRAWLAAARQAHRATAAGSSR